MKFCAECGGRVSLRTPEGDHLPRHVCEACGVVHYRNPRLVVGCVPELDGRILLCKRAIEPRRGYHERARGTEAKGHQRPSTTTEEEPQ